MEDEVITGTDADENVNLSPTKSDVVEIELDHNDGNMDINQDIPKPAAYEGNAYDITSLIALITGVILLFTCLTCNMGVYFLPFVAIVLGIIGAVMAKKSADPQRTQLLSWLGIGSGVLVLLIALLGILLYIVMLILVVRGMGYNQL